MANFDAIFDENLQEDERSSRVSDEHVQVTPEPVVIRGVGHMTVWVVFTVYQVCLEVRISGFYKSLSFCLSYYFAS